MVVLWIAVLLTLVQERRRWLKRDFETMQDVVVELTPTIDLIEGYYRLHGRYPASLGAAGIPSPSSRHGWLVEYTEYDGRCYWLQVFLRDYAHYCFWDSDQRAWRTKGRKPQEVEWSEAYIEQRIASWREAREQREAAGPN